LKIALLIFAVIAALGGIALVVLARGPEGTVVRKEIADRIAAAATECDLKVRGTAPVPPTTVRLSVRACVKHQIKTFGRRIGILYPEADSGEDYLMVGRKSDAAIHCLSRVSGDHLIGIDLQFARTHHSVGHRLRNALQKQFRHDILSLVVTET
jgi:hypothetical protein